MYPRNNASPERIAVGQVVLISDGTVQSTAVVITVRGQGGAEATGGGTTDFGGDNTVYYTPTQAETNFTSFVVIASKASCFSVSQTIVTTASVTAGQVRLEGVTHTDAAIPTVDTLTNLPAITANWITAAGIAASAMDGKGDWNIDKTGYSLTQTFPANFADLAIVATTGKITVGTNDDKAGYSISGTISTLDGLENIAATDIVSGGAINTTTGAVDTVTANTDMRGTDNAIKPSIVSTADSGTTTTLVDAALTEGDTDYWKGSWVRFTSGTIAGQARLITGFAPASDTVTFGPATTAAVGTNTYEIIAAANIDLVNTVTTNTDMVGTTGALLAADINLTAGVLDEVAALTGHTAQTGDSFGQIGPAGAGLTDLGGMSTGMKAEVNVEAKDVMVTDTHGEPAQGTPGETVSMEYKIAMLYKTLINEKDYDGTTINIKNFAGTVVDQKRTASETAGTYTEENIVTGP